LEKHFFIYVPKKCAEARPFAGRPSGFVVCVDNFGFINGVFLMGHHPSGHLYSQVGYPVVLDHLLFSLANVLLEPQANTKYWSGYLKG